MKNNFLKVVLLAAILFAGASCVKDSVDNAGNETAVKTGSITLASSRVSFDGSSFEWKSGDQVGVHFIGFGPDMGNLLGTISVNEGVARVIFEYPASEWIDGSDFVIYHPYNASLEGITDWATELVFNVSPRQVQPNAGINVACLPLLSAPHTYGDGETAVLYNLGSIVKFNVYGNADEVVKSVSISTDGYGGVFSSGKAKLKYTEAASTEAVGKDTPVSLTRTDEGDAFAAQCTYKGDNNGVDVTLANPTYSGANRANGAVAYAVVYPFGAKDTTDEKETRKKNAYVAVTTDKALYTWTRNLEAKRGAGLVLNLNLANADDRYTVQSYTNLRSGRLMAKISTEYPTKTKYVEGTRTWMVQNLNWAGYDDKLGLASDHATHATEFGRYYSYYTAAATAEPASGSSGWSECAGYSRSNMVIEDRNSIDEMGLTYNSPAFTFGYKPVEQNKKDENGEEIKDENGKPIKETVSVPYNNGEANINVHLDPSSETGKMMRAQHQFNCPKGWHLPNDIDLFHLYYAVSDTYARGTSWTNGEAGFGGSALTTMADPFYNYACSGATDNFTTAPTNRGFESGTGGNIMGPSAHWFKGSDNKMNNGLWTNYTDKDTAKGWLDAHNRPMFATQECYAHIKEIKNICDPATYLVNGNRDEVGFNALPSGYASTTIAGVGNYFTMLVHGSYLNTGQNGFHYILQFDYNQSGFRRISKARSNTTFKGSVRCVKNYEHIDVESDASVGSWGITELKWNEEIDF